MTEQATQPTQDSEISNAPLKIKRPKIASREVAGLVLESLRQRGGVDWLNSLKDREFCSILARAMPKDVNVEGDITLSFGGWLDKLRQIAISDVHCIDEDAVRLTLSQRYPAQNDDHNTGGTDTAPE